MEMECDLAELRRRIIAKNIVSYEEELWQSFLRCLESCPLFLKESGGPGDHMPMVAVEPVPDLIDEVDKYIRANLAMDKKENLRLDNMASHFGISKSALKASFTEKRGIAPHLFIVRCRMEWAMELLTQTKLSINEIAYTLGYEQPWHFSRDFKKYTGKPPMEQRKEL
jgi:AraC-like DNA-binding protein